MILVARLVFPLPIFSVWKSRLQTQLISGFIYTLRNAVEHNFIQTYYYLKKRINTLHCTPKKFLCGIEPLFSSF